MFLIVFHYLYLCADTDKSGNVTATEVTATLDLIQGLMDGTETDPVKVSKAIFRIFDTDVDKDEEDETIKIEEMYNFFAEIVELLSTLATQILTHLQDAITGEPLERALQLFCDSIQDEDNPGLYPVPRVVDYFSEKYTSQILSEVLDLVRGLWESFSSEPALENIRSTFIEQAHEFLKRFKEAVCDEKLHTDALAKIGSECARNILSCIVHEGDKVMALLMDQLPHVLGSLSFMQRGEETFKEIKIDGNSIKIKMEIFTTKITSKKDLRKIDIPFNNIHEIVKSAAEALRQQFNDSFLSKFSKSVAKLLDPTNTNGVSKTDFDLLLALMFALFEISEDCDDLKTRFDSLLAAWCSLSAKPAEGQDLSSTAPSLDFEGILACVKAVLHLAFVVAEEVVATAKEVAMHVANPALELALSIKFQMHVGSESELTFNDIEVLKNMFQ